MTTTEALTPALTYRQREFHAFESAGTQFVYLVPSGSIFAIDKIGREILDRVKDVSPTREELVGFLTERGYAPAEIETSLMELEFAEVIQRGDFIPQKPKLPEKNFPLQRVVLNLTNQCNLACAYCYEYSEDKISKSEGKPNYMSVEVAHAAIDMILGESEGRGSIHVTFFGGETLLNFPAMRSTVEYS